MKFNKPVVELINERTSIRSYEEEDIEKEKLEKLKAFIEDINKEAKIKARFTLTENSDGSKGGKKLGTYGVISGVDTFIVGILDKDEKDAVEFGYLFEKIILFATDLELGTCWLGGTFNKSAFEGNFDLDANEFIPIVSPVGKGKENAGLIARVMEIGSGSDKRKPWDELFFEGKSLEPMDETMAGKYEIPLEAVRLGPSAVNKQPWRVVKDGNDFHFYLVRSRGYKVAAYDLQKNDIGIAKCHFELTARELGLEGSWIKEDFSIDEDWEYICTWSGK